MTRHSVTIVHTLFYVGESHSDALKIFSSSPKVSGLSTANVSSCRKLSKVVCCSMYVDFGDLSVVILVSEEFTIEYAEQLDLRSSTASLVSVH